MDNSSTKNNSIESKGYTGWFLYYSDIKSGESAILSGNKIAFFTIHSTGIIFIWISVIACITVIVSVFRNSKKDKWDFSDRFPLYLAIADGLWCISNFCGDQIILLTTQVFPEKAVAERLAVFVAIFFGYQQTMNAGLCLYTYMKVVRRVSLDLGKWEWKLLLFCLTFSILTAVMFYSLGVYGNSGYWFLIDYNTEYGLILGAQVCITITLHAVGTAFAYRSIKKVVGKQKRVVSLQTSMDKNPSHNQRFSTATNCLTTFIYISLCLYCPFAITAWANLIGGFFGVLDPFNSWLIAVAANSGGWVNAWGYFYNKRIKDERRLALAAKRHIPSVSTCSSTA